MQPFYIMTCGVNHTGKTTLGKQLQKQLSPSIVIDNDVLRVFGQEQFPDLYERTKGFENREGNAMNMKMFFAKQLLTYGWGNNIHCIHTACNMYASQRKKFLSLAKQYKTKTCLVHFSLPIAVLHQRIEKAHKVKDERLYSRGYYGNLERMLENFETPATHEADHFFTITDNNDNQGVIESILSLVSS